MRQTESRVIGGKIRLDYLLPAQITEEIRAVRDAG